MRRIANLCALAAAGLLALAAGCGSSGDDRQAAAANPADLDDGPPAAQTMTPDADRAAWGKILFTSKTCVTCHTLGERKQGPDLIGVTDRRTERWIFKQITDPVWMVQNDSLSTALFKEYNLQMTDLQVKDAEAEALMQYLLRETGKARAGG